MFRNVRFKIEFTQNTNLSINDGNVNTLNMNGKCERNENLLPHNEHFIMLDLKN